LNIKVTISYDGSKFNGFQRQNSGVKTVANKLENILKSLKIDTTINASGRTDSGVHASRQVLNFFIPEFWSDIKKLKYMINQKAFPDICVEEISEVDESFHARYSAKRRVYRYVVSSCKPSVFMSDYVKFVDSIDEKAIKSAIKIFEGSYDFRYFMKSKSDVKSTTREIYSAKFYRYKEFYIFSFEANGYLRSQIRMMVDFLLKISDGKFSEKELYEQLCCVKRYSTDIVEPNGLYLSRIKY